MNCSYGFRFATLRKVDAGMRVQHISLHMYTGLHSQSIYVGVRAYETLRAGSFSL